MAPPELAADAPVLDVVHPLLVGVDPVLGHKAHLARLHSINRFLRDALAGRVLGADLVHRHKPLVGQHRLDHLAGAGAARHHQLVFLDLHHQAQGLQVGHHLFAGRKAVQALVGGRCLVVDLGIEREHADHWQAVALAHGVVVGVMRRGDFDHAGAKGSVHIGVGNYRDASAAQGQLYLLADQVGVALVFGVYHHGYVAQQGFRAGGGHHKAWCQRAVDSLRAIGKGVADVPQEAVFLFALHFQVAHRAHQHRVPVDQAFAAVNQTLLIELDKGFGHGARQLGVHGEVLAAPVHGVTHAAHLCGDGLAAFLFPLPHLGYKGVSPQVMPADALGLQLPLHHDLGGNAGVVGARYPDRVGAQHAVIAGERVHDGLVERMPHVQRACDIGRRQLDGKGGRSSMRRATATEAGMGVVAAFPLGAPMRLQGGRLKGFGQAVEPGLLQFVVHGDLQGEPLSLCDRSVLAACCAALISLCQALAALMLL